MIGFERDPPGHYFGFFIIAQEKKRNEAIKKYKEQQK